MLRENMEGDIPLVVALKCVRATLLNKIDGRSSDQVGVVLFGTREKNNSAQKDFIYTLYPLDIPDAARINEVDRLIENLTIFDEKYGSTEENFSLADLLWVCSDIMATAPKFSAKRIFLITDNDDPVAKNPAYKKASIQRAKDLSIAGVEICLFGLDQPSVEFDTGIFYKDIASFDQSDESSITSSSTVRLGELLNKVKSSEVKTRSEFRVPFEITPQLSVGVRGYNMVIEKKISAPKNYSTSTTQLQEVKSLTRWQCEDTQQYLTPLDIKHGYEYGGELVAFTKDEIKTLLTVREPSLLLLGFKQRSTLKNHHQIVHPYFIYPDENQYEGSNNLLFTLLDTLIKRNRIAICSFVRRSNAIPKIVALLPQSEKVDGDGNQVDPPGFQMVILPYADEIRPIPPNVSNITVEDSAREAAKIIIEKLMIKGGYDPMKYDNPALSNHKTMIQRIALDSQKGIEQPVDNTLPNYDFMDSELANDIERFKKLVGLDNITEDDLHSYAKTPAKRKQEEEQPQVLGDKRIKIETEEIVELWKAGKLSKATNQYLKDYLTTVGLYPKKLKADLVKQVEDYLKNTQG
ncbi:unnamed protein product [Mucor hiemalis]